MYDKEQINNGLKLAHPLSGSSSTWFLVKLQFENISFWGKGKTRVPGEKPLGARERTSNKLNPHMASTPIQPRSQGSLLPALRSVGRVGENPGNEVVIILHLILHSAVHIYDFHIFITSSSKHFIGLQRTNSTTCSQLNRWFSCNLGRHK